MVGYSIVEIQAPKNEETEEDYSGKVNEAFNTKVILMLRLLRVKLNKRKYFQDDLEEDLCDLQGETNLNKQEDLIVKVYFINIYKQWLQMHRVLMG